MSHWYSIDGEARHFVQKKDGSGLRASTLRDAKANGWLPSVTTICELLAKPQLVEWKVRNGIVAAITTPRIVGENEDAFIERVLANDAQDISTQAKDLGSRIHDALELYVNGQRESVASDLLPWLEPAAKKVLSFGRVIDTELVLIGDGYAGRTDLILDCGDYELIVDWKTCGNIPKDSYPDHKIQLAAYAEARLHDKPIKTANAYISTKDQGCFSVIDNGDWKIDYESGFDPLFKIWKHLKHYYPEVQSKTHTHTQESWTVKDSQGQ